MKLDDYNQEQRFTATVLSSERMTAEASSAEVREIVLEVDGATFDYAAGQSIGVITPGPHPLGNAVGSVGGLAPGAAGDPGGHRGRGLRPVWPVT